MRNCIEGFAEVQDSHVDLFVLVERREYILSCSKKLSFSGIAGAEAVVEICQNVIGFEVRKDVATDDVFEDFAGDGGERDRSVV